jgi:hypothetical protein
MEKSDLPTVEQITISTSWGLSDFLWKIEEEIENRKKELDAFKKSLGEVSLEIERRYATMREENRRKLEGGLAHLPENIRAAAISAVMKEIEKGTGVPRTGPTCNVAGCSLPHRSKGYCSAHYQAARRYGWPQPAPAGFTPPKR